MTQQPVDLPDSNHALSLSELPNSALQAIYHAVTGKTESMSRDHYGNVVVRFHDIRNIVHQIVDQLKIHHNVCDPTITIVTKYDNEKSVTHSSWERFEKLQENQTDVTSEITIKLETVIRIPNTVSDQRITVSLNIDSAMPLILEDKKKKHEKFDFGFFIFSRQPWRTVTYKIEFVDFLVAKNFASTIDDWFKALPKQAESKPWQIVFANMPIIERTLHQISYAGASAFLFSFVYFKGEGALNFANLTIATAILLLIIAIYNFFRKTIIDSIKRTAISNLVPSLIILNRADESELENIERGRSSTVKSIVVLIISAIGNIGMNIAASYIYAG